MSSASSSSSSSSSSPSFSYVEFDSLPRLAKFLEEYNGCDVSTLHSRHAPRFVHLSELSQLKYFSPSFVDYLSGVRYTELGEPLNKLPPHLIALHSGSPIDNSDNIHTEIASQTADYTPRTDVLDHENVCSLFSRDDQPVRREWIQHLPDTLETLWIKRTDYEGAEQPRTKRSKIALTVANDLVKVINKQAEHTATATATATTTQENKGLAATLLSKLQSVLPGFQSSSSTSTSTSTPTSTSTAAEVESVAAGSVCAEVSDGHEEYMCEEHSLRLAQSLPHLKHLGLSCGCPEDLQFIPQHIQKLSIYFYDAPNTLDQWPAALSYLSVDADNEREVELPPFSNLPSTLQVLKLPCSWDYPHYEELISALPSSLLELHYGLGIEHVEDLFERLPRGLQVLAMHRPEVAIPACHAQWNVSAAPDTLTILNISLPDQPVQKWPSQLQVLKIPNAFNQPLDSLPSTVHTLSLPQSFAQVNTKWPASLRHLELGASFSDSHLLSQLPKQLESLAISIPLYRKLDQTQFQHFTALKELTLTGKPHSTVDVSTLPASLSVLKVHTNAVKLIDWKNSPLQQQVTILTTSSRNSPDEAEIEFAEMTNDSGKLAALFAPSFSTIASEDQPNVVVTGRSIRLSPAPSWKQEDEIVPEEFKRPYLERVDTILSTSEPVSKLDICDQFFTDLQWAKTIELIEAPHVKAHLTHLRISYCGSLQFRDMQLLLQQISQLPKLVYLDLSVLPLQAPGFNLLSAFLASRPQVTLVGSPGDFGENGARLWANRPFPERWKESNRVSSSGRGFMTRGQATDDVVPYVPIKIPPEVLVPSGKSTIVLINLPKPKCLKEVTFEESELTTSLCVGDGFQGFITSNGSFYMSGDNENQQASCYTIPQREIDPTAPIRIPFPEDFQVTQAALGMRVTVVKTKDGRALAFGGHDYKQCGYEQKFEAPEETEETEDASSSSSSNSTSLFGASPFGSSSSSFGAFSSFGGPPEKEIIELDRYLPRELAAEGVRSVGAGLHSTFVVSNSGKVYGCGHNGHGLVQPAAYVEDMDYWSKTDKLSLIDNIPHPILQVAAEFESAFALTEDRRIVEWGKTGIESKPFVAPQLRPDIQDVKQMTLFSAHLIALLSNDQLVGCLLDRPAFTISIPSKPLVISYFLVLAEDGLIYEIDLKDKVCTPSEELVAPAGYKFTNLASGRCGRPVMIAKKLE